MNLSKLKNILEKNAVLIFSVSATVCTVCSVITAINATPKAYSIIKEHGEELTPKEIKKTTVKAYAPTIIFSAASIGCVAGAFIFSEKQRKALTAAWLGTVQLYEQYRKKVIDIYGEYADDNICAHIQCDNNCESSGLLNDDHERLYYIDGFTKDGYITSTPYDILLAEYKLNRILTTKGYAKLNDFAQLLGSSPNDIFDEVGWSLVTCGEMDGKFWIDFCEEVETIDDDLEVIHITFEPTPYDNYIDRIFPPISSLPY